MARPKRQVKTKSKAVEQEAAEKTKLQNRAKSQDGSGDASTTKAKGRKRKIPASDAKDQSTKGKNAKTSPKEEPSTSSADAEEKGEMKKLTFSGVVPVDEQCTECIDDYHVFVDKGPNLFDVYNAMLNQTNIGFNNNKYYLLQLLEHNSSFKYMTWFRWGRVGKVAGKCLTGHGANLDDAKRVFAKKFRDKTGNSWQDTVSPISKCKNFEKVPGKYDLLEMDYGEEEEKQEKKKTTQKKEPKKEKKEIESKLDKRLQEVIDLIFNMKEFEESVKEMEFDVKKAPLGKLTTKQIKAGFETLKKIESCIQKGNFSGRELSDACSEFYTRIPHDFGMKVPPLIRTPQQLKQKIQLLEALGDIQVAVQLIDDIKDEEDIDIKQRHYESLACKLEPFDTDHKEFKMVKEYVLNSHGSSHQQYDLTVENVYNVDREGEDARFKKDIGNRMLLWHGSRLTNWCGILKQGLRIAPPEAPVTGYMFGKGVYFADMVSKSANYCFANKRQPRGFLLLCEVALGNTNDKKSADYNANKLPKGKSSTKGLGREVPDPKGNTKLDCGTIAPLGKPTRDSGHPNCSLMYNEYIVYDVAQIKARYLVKVKFGYQSLW